MVQAVTIMFYSVKAVVPKLWAVDLGGLEFFQREYEIIGRAERMYVSLQRIWLFLAVLYSDILC